MIDFKITKKTKILEVNNSMCHNYYYLIQGRLYNETKTKYKKFAYIDFFDIFDLQEYFDKDIITKNDIKYYLSEKEAPLICYIENYDDKKHIQEFFDYCNETITNFNNIYNK
jgi:hypothetical protein